MGKRALGEFLATVAALGAVTLYLQLSDPTSMLRLKLEELRERAEDWSVKSKVDSLIESVHHTGEGT